MVSRRAKAAAVAAMLCGWVHFEAAAAVLRVPKDHATIQMAVDAASDGDTILVAKGTYHESLTIQAKNDLTIVGKGKVVVDASGSQKAVVVLGTGGVTLRHLTLRSPTFGLQTNNAQELRVEQCRIEVANGTGAQVIGGSCVFEGTKVLGAGAAGVWIAGSGSAVLDCKVVGAWTKGILVGVGGVTVDGTLVRGAVQAGVFVDQAQEAAGVLVTACTIRDVSGDGVFAQPVSTPVTVLDNVVKKPVGDGIEFDAFGGGNAVLGNTVLKAGGTGVVLRTAQSVVGQNVVKKPGLHGVFVRDFSDDAYVVQNQVKKAGQWGFLAAGDNGLYVENESKKSTKGGLSESGAGNAYVGNDFQ